MLQQLLLHLAKTRVTEKLKNSSGMNLSTIAGFGDSEQISLLQKIGLIERIGKTDEYRFNEWIRSLDKEQVESLINDFQNQIIKASHGELAVTNPSHWEYAYTSLRNLMEKYDPNLVALTKIMEARFNTLKTQNPAAFVFDVDGNLTKKVPVTLQNGAQRIESVLVEEIMKKLLDILESGKTVVLITGRMSKVTEEIKNFGESDVAAVLEQFHIYVDSLTSDQAKKARLLRNIYLTSENGLGQTTNGLRSDELGFKRYDAEFFPKMMKKRGWVDDPAMNQQLTHLLNGIDFDGIKLASERMFKFRGKPEELPALRQHIVSEIRSAGLWMDDRMEVVLAGEVVDVLYYRVNKFSSLVFLAEELGIRDNEHSIVIKSGDNADPFGNDFPLVSQPWGMSSGKYDPFNPCMVSLSLISGQEKGADTTLWALEQLGI